MTPLSDYVFDLDTGWLCLDFVNTRGSSGDHLRTYSDLVAFAQQSALVTPDDADWLHAQAEREPLVAQTVLTRALALREAVRGIFSALAAGNAPAQADLSVLNADLALSLPNARIEPRDDGGFSWTWSGRALDCMLWPVSRSAADLLTDGRAQQVRECGASDCQWLFVDTSKNRSRQWCSMASCGNREKARRHYQRLKERRAGLGVSRLQRARDG